MKSKIWDWIPWTLPSILVVITILGITIHAHSQTLQTEISWVNAGNPGYTCLAITEVNGVQSSGYYFCPNQATSFQDTNYYNIGSLYMPSATIEDADITWQTGISTGASTFDRTGTFSEFGWSCTTTQHYQYVRKYNQRGRLQTYIVTLPGGVGNCVGQN